MPIVAVRKETYRMLEDLKEKGNGTMSCIVAVAIQEYVAKRVVKSSPPPPPALMDDSDLDAQAIRDHQLQIANLKAATTPIREYPEDFDNWTDDARREWFRQRRLRRIAADKSSASGKFGGRF